MKCKIGSEHFKHGRQKSVGVPDCFRRFIGRQKIDFFLYLFLCELKALCWLERTLDVFCDVVGVPDELEDVLDVLLLFSFFELLICVDDEVF